METNRKWLFVILLFLVFMASAVFADAPPDPGGGPGGGAGPVGGGAPVDGGSLTLIIFGIMYGVKKAIALIKKTVTTQLH